MLDDPSYQIGVLQLALSGENMADRIMPDMLAEIGQNAISEFDLDLSSMSEWLDDMQRGIDLAKLIKKDKDYPFKNASNVKYPLITTAALQFNARAYPAVVAPEGVVKVATFGADPDGQKAARAERVGAHMSWQLLHEIEEWETETDKLLLQLPIVGWSVRKVWYDPVRGRARCRVVDPGMFIVNSNAKSLEEAPRCSEKLALYPDEIETRVRSGWFTDVDGIISKDNEDRHRAEDFIEQHCRVDMDGDGYEEPYIVTVHVKTKTVVRVVADFGQEDIVIQGSLAEGGKVVSIRRGTYFVDYQFMPSMDGGLQGTGLGVLLGDISEAINSIMNMMIDAGHRASLGGGFIGGDFKVKGAAQRMNPGEWRPVNTGGGDIKNSLVPLTFPGPDSTLFQMLGLLIDSGKEVASVNEVMTGDAGGRQQTATTTLALIEQGMAVFTAAYKRIFRSLKREFKVLAKINADTVDPQTYAMFHDQPPAQQQGPQMPGMPQQMGHNGGPAFDPRQDYNARDMDIAPVADPRSVTKMQEAAKAQVLMGLAESGMVDKAEAVERILQAASIPDVDALVPKPDPMAQQMAKMNMKAAEADLMLKMAEVEKAIAEISETRSKATLNMADAEATKAGVSLDAMKLRLEATRDEIGRIIGRGTGRMAAIPGRPAAPQAIGAPNGGMGAGMQGRGMGGQPMAGGGTPIA